MKLTIYIILLSLWLLSGCKTGKFTNNTKHLIAEEKEEYQDNLEVTHYKHAWHHTEENGEIETDTLEFDVHSTKTNH